MNDYPEKFIDNAMKARQHVREKTEYQSSVSLSYICSASYKICLASYKIDLTVY